MTEARETVTLKIDDRSVTVPKGTNLIEAARSAGIAIPHYCYHPHLSIAGNCRMCQIEIVGRPKLEIACNTVVQDGMEIRTQHTNPKVKASQESVLEFILINHPLDCTVCDQSGHCKLQDYHFEYNAKPSRFVEEKVHKVKAEPLGPEVILDGERCIMCTRCIRFCDEVTKTSELGMLNRGDRSVISINSGKVLDNALSGTVVDLCPVGALTHRRWRFNTRIWFSKEAEGICPGCSTGCNVRVASRDGEIVQVKARLNAAVNKEWLCDEGRYGFGRFLPKSRLTSARAAGRAVEFEKSIENAATMLRGKKALIFLSPDLLLEEYAVLHALVERSLKGSTVVVAHRSRALSEVEAILVSPDRSANILGAKFLRVCGEDAEQSYIDALRQISAADVGAVLVVGERGILREDVTSDVEIAMSAKGIWLGTDATHPFASRAVVALPGRSILEKAGLLLNSKGRLQYTDRLIDFPPGTEPEWRWLNRLAEKLGGKIVTAATDRDLTIGFLASEPRLKELSIAQIRAGGVELRSSAAGSTNQTSQMAG